MKPPYRCLAAIALALALATGASADDSDDLSAVVEAIPLDVKQVESLELDSARRRLSASLAALDRRLIPGSSNAAAWKDYLGWQTLDQYANGDSAPKLTELQLCIDRLTSGERGLELDEFQQVANDARRLFDLSALATVEDPASFTQKQAGQLAGRLRSDPRLLDPRGSFAVEQRLDLFAGVPGAEQVVAAVAQRFDRSNIFASASERLVNRAAQRPVHQVSPVSETILGTRVRGTGDTNGWLRVSTVPSTGAARFTLKMSGGTDASTLGVNGPACIRSTSNTQFVGSKLVQLTRHAFATSPSAFHANTCSQTQSVSKRGGGFGERIVVAVAKKQIAKQKSRADAIAGQRAALRLEENFDSEVRQQLSEARRDFEQQVLAPFERRHAAPRRIQFHTTSDSLELEMLQAVRGELAAPDPPPPAVRRDFTLRLHQSGANNMASALVGGAVLSRSSLEEPAKLNVPLPDWAERLAERREPAGEDGKPEDFKPWKITFRRSRPLSFRFVENQIEVLLHAASLQAGEDAYPNWDLILRLRPVLVDGQLVLERIGKAEALPTGFDPNSGRRLSSGQVGFRNNLMAALNPEGEGGLPSEFPLKDIKLREGRGELIAKELDCIDGWLTTGWDLK